MNNKKLLISLIALVLILILTFVFYLYKVGFIGQSKEEALLKETNNLVSKVSKLMILPENETPTIATITDPDRLIDQKFFANSKKGDKVLVFPVSQKAILYRPDINKIVEVAPINLGGGEI